jgi:uroporphyrinogen-III synthase
VILTAAWSDRTCEPLAAKHLILCLSEPRATRLARRFAPWGLDCLQLQLHRLHAIGLNATAALCIAELKSSGDVLLPVSPGAVEMLHEGMRRMLPGHRLESQAWLCVGAGTQEEVERHDPTAACYLPPSGPRDLATLLEQPAVQAWVGNRKVHLICSQARATGALGRLPEWIRRATQVYPVYAETWHPLTQEVFERLGRILVQTDDRCLVPSAESAVWVVGSLALLQHLYAELQGMQTAGEPASFPRAQAVIAALCTLPLVCPHARIAEEARQMGHSGPVILAAGPTEIQGALARMDALWSRLSPPAPQDLPVREARPRSIR